MQQTESWCNLLNESASRKFGYQLGLLEYHQIKMEKMNCVRRVIGPLRKPPLLVMLLAKQSAGLTIHRAGKFILSSMVTGNFLVNELYYT